MIKPEISRGFGFAANVYLLAGPLHIRLEPRRINR